MQLDITGMALYPAGRCTWCGNDAVELAVTRESDEITETGAVVMLSCRVCAPDSFYEPDAEIITGEPIDGAGEQLGMFEIPRASTFGAQDRAATAGQTSLL